MKDTEDVQRLIRLKQYESPGEAYFKDFTEALKERQRSELLRRSSLSLFAERFGMWCSERFEPRYAFPGAGACALLTLGTFLLWRPAPPAAEGGDFPSSPSLASSARETPLDLSGTPAEDIQLTLPSERAGGTAGALPAAGAAGSGVWIFDPENGAEAFDPEGQSLAPIFRWTALREL